MAMDDKTRKERFEELERHGFSGFEGAAICSQNIKV
jgi:hypothetical protein